MKQVLDDVRAFHTAADLPIRPFPGFPSDERTELRDALLAEEYREYQDAMEQRNIVEVADALADMVYIIAGTALELGIPLDKVFSEVQRTNMAKVDSATGKVHRRADGKILKPEGWRPPDIARILIAEKQLIAKPYVTEHQITEYGCCDCPDCLARVRP